MLLDDVLKEFLFHIQIQNYSKKTQKGYKNNNLAFQKFIMEEFDITEIEDVRPQHIKSYFQYLQQKGRKPTYINGILRNIRSFFKYCVNEGYIPENQNPCLKVNWMKQPKTVIQTFTDEEIQKMVNSFKTDKWINARNKLILMTFVDTGIRASELIDIKVDDVTETTIKIHGKGNKERFVYISPVLKKYMIKYERMTEFYFKDKMRTNNYFLSYRGLPLTVEALERVVKIAGKRAKVREEIRCSPHTIRHFYAIKQLKLGQDVYTVSRLLGHEDLNITRTYLSSLADSEIVEMGRMASPLMNLGRKSK
ncbi:UNVERIFIED_ORG: integrase/recombinase XerD [Heyndrickxia coagulans]